jgi:hypothetical protein
MSIIAWNASGISKIAKAIKRHIPVESTDAVAIWRFLDRSTCPSGL